MEKSVRNNVDYTKVNDRIRVSSFVSRNNSKEIYISINPQESSLGFAEQIDRLLNEYKEVRTEFDLDSNTEIFLRFYVSDIVNQDDPIRKNIRSLIGAEESVIGIIQQPPLPPSKVALLAYHIKSRGLVKEVLKREDDGIVRSSAVSHGGYKSIWAFGLRSNEPKKEQSSYEQAGGIFETLENLLRLNGASVEENLIRTWIYVHDIDNNYRGMTRARGDFFEGINLTAETHFIASTGIEGHILPPHNLVSMDTLSIVGLKDEQIIYMKALDYLSPTHVYNVHFERGTKIDFGDRSILYVSGTASIDKDGRVLHEGDILKQSERTLINMEALLKNHGSSLKDLMYIIVYLRDIADAYVVKNFLNSNLSPSIPYVLAYGRICRPTWLVEMEGTAAIHNNDSRFADFSK